MKTKIIRIVVVLAALLLALIIFVMTSYFSNRSVTTINDALVKVGTFWTSLEKHWITKNNQRYGELEWLEPYRNSSLLLKNPDTILFGIYDDKYKDGVRRILALEDSLNTRLPIIQVYTAWGSKKKHQFPLLEVNAIRDLGSIPMITWEPWLDVFDNNKYPQLKGKDNVNMNGLALIAQGVFDDYIDKWIERVKNFDSPFFLRFGHEMNDPYRYPWGPHNNTPETYIAAWRHVHQKFQAANLSHVLWVWSPHPAYDNEFMFYPGHDCVDWIGLTGLNYGKVVGWSQWWTFEEIIQTSYEALSLYNKPIMISEFGSLSYGGHRAGWYADALQKIHTQYPMIKSILFFHSLEDFISTKKILDWTFLYDQETLEVLKYYFNARDSILKNGGDGLSL
ncbi:MAG: hypothetical protein JJU02_11385 [Cryomorphaceae bacterium]|nr:hypothetical protein [Cryomorphaceae bacterium]